MVSGRVRMRGWMVCIVGGLLSGCAATLNQYAVVRPIPSGSSVAVMAYGGDGQYDEGMAEALMRRLMAEGYAVKALRAVPLEVASVLAYPDVQRIMNGKVWVKTRTTFDDLLKYASEQRKPQTLFDTEVVRAKVLKSFKEGVGVSYLFVCSVSRTSRGLIYNLKGVDLETFDVIHLQRYLPPPAPSLSALFVPHFWEKRRDDVAAEFVATMKRGGWGSRYE